MGYSRGEQTEQAPQVQPESRRNLFESEDYASPFGRAMQESNLIKWQLNPEDALRQIDSRLRGYRWDSQKGSWSKEGAVPLCNEEGIRTFINSVSVYTNRIFLLSNFTDWDINRMASENRNTIINIISLRRQELEIHKANRARILHLCDHTVYAVLRSAYKGGMLKFLKPTQRVVETHTQTDVGRRRGFISGLFSRGQQQTEA